MKAIKCYASEKREDIHPRNIMGILNIARYRGQEVGVKYAEAFILYKEVIQ